MHRVSQAVKIREIGEALVSSGLVTLDEQAKAVGLCRSTTWTILKANHKNSGLSATLINVMLDSPGLPPAVRTKILEYVEEKIAGRYGHGRVQISRFVERLEALKQTARSTHVVIELRTHALRSPARQNDANQERPARWDVQGAERRGRLA